MAKLRGAAPINEASGHKGVYRGLAVSQQAVQDIKKYSVAQQVYTAQPLRIWQLSLTIVHEIRMRISAGQWELGGHVSPSISCPLRD